MHGMPLPLNFSRGGPYFAALFCVALVAFWPTYLSKAPSASSSYTHLHALTAALWMLMLVAQPLAIQTRRWALHRLFGRVSYVLAPLLLISILLLAKRAWTQETFSYEGKFHTFHNVTVLPRPLQRPTPPIYTAAAITPESFVNAGRQGYSLLLAPFLQPFSTLKDQVQLYRQTLTDAGHSPDSVEIVAGYHSFLTSSAP